MRRTKLTQRQRTGLSENRMGKERLGSDDTCDRLPMQPVCEALAERTFIGRAGFAQTVSPLRTRGLARGPLRNGRIEFARGLRAGAMAVRKSARLATEMAQAASMRRMNRLALAVYRMSGIGIPVRGMTGRQRVHALSHAEAKHQHKHEPSGYASKS